MRTDINIVDVSTQFEVDAKIRTALNEYNLKYGTHLAMPVIQYNIRGTTAGRAKLRSWIVDLNPGILNTNREEFLGRIPIHELAHLVAFDQFGDTGHGDGWKLVMRRMGQEPTRCHDMDVSQTKILKAPQARFIYKCKCMEHSVSAARRTKMQNGKRYRCIHCRELIVPTNQIIDRVATHVETSKVPVHNTGTKKEQATRIIQANPNATRGVLIELLIQHVNMTKAGASTYIATIKKELGLS